MFYVPGILVVLVDQVSKWFVVHHVDNGPILGDVLRLTLTENTGAAFGLFPGARISFIVISVLAAIGLIYANRVLRGRDPWRRLALGLILGGNLGNLVDRVRSGRVTDFIDMGIGSTRWPVYNFADVAVVAGALVLGLHLLIEMRAERHAAAVPPPGRDPVPEENSADAG
jgi:signal peptidase II